jgi:hypothetical protein
LSIARALIVALVLAVLPPVAMWPLSIVDRHTLLGFLKIAESADTRVLALYFGLAAGGVGAAGLLAAFWVARGRTEGFALAALVGGAMAAGGVVMLVLGPEPSFALLDLVKGSLVVALAWVAARRSARDRAV